MVDGNARRNLSRLLPAPDEIAPQKVNNGGLDNRRRRFRPAARMIIHDIGQGLEGSTRPGRGSGQNGQRLANARTALFGPSATGERSTGRPLLMNASGRSEFCDLPVEHTMLVTLVGHEIMSGRALLMPTSASDYAHVIAACLFHDIGFVRGILKQDGADEYVIDSGGGKTALARGSSDAALMPYHVDRSKLFVMDRVAKSKLLDAGRITSAIECTRFPPARDHKKDNEEGFLVRAADLIGQLGDPHYLRKANALYYEFEEIGMNRQLGYTSPADLTNQYPQFYWSSVSVHIQPALRYLNVTSSGRQWMATLYVMFSVPNGSSIYRDCSASTGSHRLFRPEETTAPVTHTSAMNV